MCQYMSFQNTVVQVKQTKMTQNFLQGHIEVFQLPRGLDSHVNTISTEKHDECHIAKTLFMYNYLFCTIQIYCRKHFSVSLPHQLHFQISSEKCISSLPAHSLSQILPFLCLHFLAFFPVIYFQKPFRDLKDVI